MKKIVSYTLFVFLLVSLISCSNEANNSKEFTIETTLVAGGPLFEGSNTCQAELTTELSSFLEENGIKKEELVDVKLTSCVITSDQFENLNLIESINMQMFSDNFPMQNVAVANPVEENVKEVSLKIADIQEQIMPVLQEETCYIVADVTIKEDLEDDLELNTKLVFSINYYKQ
jgi:hypothetical protein